MEITDAWFPNDPENPQSLQSWIEERQPRNSNYIRWFCGVDLGKRYDPSTVAIIEVQYDKGQRRYFVRYLHRFTLRMLYSDVATQLARLDEFLKAKAVEQRKKDSITWVLDTTGVGESVAELVETAMPLADIKKVYITGGIKATVASDNYNEIHLPKSQLVSTLVAAFDAKIIYLTRDSREIDAIIDELRNYEIHVSENAGRETYGAKVGKHDDLITALGLAIWAAEEEGYTGGPMIW
ncbi:MAG: hypothetical protein WAL97_05150 [Halobacteriota archaeon]